MVPSPLKFHSHFVIVVPKVWAPSVKVTVNGEQPLAVSAVKSALEPLTIISTELEQEHPIGEVTVTEIWATPAALEFQVSV